MNHYISPRHMLDKQTKRKNMLFKSAVKDFFPSVVIENSLENRAGQRILAYDVSKVIVSTKYLIGEAGVGIGKSFVYMIALLYYHKENYERMSLVITEFDAEDFITTSGSGGTAFCFILPAPKRERKHKEGQFIYSDEEDGEDEIDLVI